MANQENVIGADVFLSIHQNSVAGDTVTCGMETWYNADKRDGSAELAALIQQFASEATGAKDRGLKSSSELVVTRETSMASCLLEAGFLSNRAERRNLTDPAYQERLAEGIAEGILVYLNLV